MTNSSHASLMPFSVKKMLKTGGFLGGFCTMENLPILQFFCCVQCPLCLLADEIFQDEEEVCVLIVVSSCQVTQPW